MTVDDGEEHVKLAFSMVVNDDEQALHWMEMVRAGGFDGVEPTFGLEGTLPTAGDPRPSAEKLRKLADKTGLKIPSMRGGPGFWPTFASSDSKQREKALDLAAKALEAVKIMGGDTLLIVPGQWDPAQTYAGVWKSAIETVRGVAEIAKRIGIRVGLENVENRFLFSPRDWMQFLDEVGSEWVRMYFDVGNTVYLKLGYPDQWIKELGKKYITRIHFKDATNDARLTYMLEGAVNWPAVRGALKEIGYDDWVGIELTPPAHHPAAFLAGACTAAREILK